VPGRKQTEELTRHKGFWVTEEEKTISQRPKRMAFAWKKMVFVGLIRTIFVGAAERRQNPNHSVFRYYAVA
jgi:hypothetical protein